MHEVALMNNVNKLDTYNPAAPDELVASYVITEESELDVIIQSAQSAQSEWAEIPQPRRGAIIGEFLDALEGEKDQIASVMTMETGKVLAESHGEVAKALGEGRAMIARASNASGEVLPSQVPGTLTYTVRRPRGVVVGINPWNFPFSTPMRKAIPALLYGNAIILKPASLAPGALVKFQEIADAFFPKGLVRTVVGNGALASTLVGHDGVAAVSFTGSTSVGKKVAQMAVSHLAEVSLELGGKNPVIVHDSHDLALVAEQVATAAFAVSGQRCTAISRVLVHESLVESMVELLASQAVQKRPEPDSKDGGGIGPLISKAQLDSVATFVERAQGEGAKVVAGGEHVASKGGGFYYAPTVLGGVTREMEVAREEVFGPVIAVISYSNIEEGLEVANDVAYGLSACLYSENCATVDEFLSRCDAGMLHVNCGSFPENHLPFVGVKDSALGVGGSNGQSVIHFYTTEHSIYQRAKV